jgi:hypothetical protein
MDNTSIERRGSSSLARRGLAVVVLIVAAYILLKLVIGFVTAIAGTVAIILAIVAIIWAIRTL